jgi:MFS family permease
VNGTTRSIWGYLMDKFNFKILMFIISFIELGVSTTIYYFANNPYIFVLENILVACCLSGSTLFIPLFHKIFGKTYGAQLYGLTGIFIGIASLAGPFLIKLIVKEDEDYLTVYLIGGALCFIKTLALICFKENRPYIFENTNNDNGKMSIIRATQLSS